MILDSDLAIPFLEQESAEAAPKLSSAVRWWWPVAVFAGYLALILALQLASGAYCSEFSGYPDEPAHYVTSTMVWDYVHHFHFQSPLKFARDYYDHYPKVALGHWPPVFYLVQASWMLIFSASRASVRLEIAFTSAVLAFVLFRRVQKQFGWVPGLVAGILFVASPLVQTYSDQEMAEILLTLLCFWSAYYIARFTESSEWKYAALYAGFFAMAVMTKGNGWLLAMLPPAVALFTGKWGFLFSRALLFFLILVFAVCVPWQMMTMRMAERGWEGGAKPSSSYTLSALVEYLQLFPSLFGSLLLVAMGAGIVYLCFIPLFRRRRMGSFAASMLALILAVWVFHSVVPAGVEDRKLVIAMPAMVYFIVAGGFWLGRSVLIPVRWHAWSVNAAMLLLLGCFGAQAFAIPHLEHFGYNEVARYFADHDAWKDSKILISSNSGGEGLFISELAMIRPDPTIEVVRATKALATVEWNGSDYRCLFATQKELLRFIVQRNIRFVIVDRFAPVTNYIHDDLVKRIVADSRHFTRIAVFPRPRSQGSGQVEVYQSSL